MQKAAAGQPLTVRTLDPLADDPVLAEAWRLQQKLAQLFACAFDERPTPEDEPPTFRLRLAEAADAPGFEALTATLTQLRAEARAAFDVALPPALPNAEPSGNASPSAALQVAANSTSSGDGTSSGAR